MTFITPIAARAVFSMAFLICSFVSSSATKASLRVLIGTVGGTIGVKNVTLSIEENEEMYSDLIFVLKS